MPRSNFFGAFNTAMKTFLSILIATILINPVHTNDDELIEYIRTAAQPLTTERDLNPLIEAAGDRRFVLLGEASHGTSEYYTWRTKISKRLIEEKGFNFIAIEGDWTAAYQVNKFIKDLPGAATDPREVLVSFNRWPQWMWNNEEIKELIVWLREYNLERPENERIGFYGVDIYAAWDSIDEVIGYFDDRYPEKAGRVRNAYGCLLAFDDDPQNYARAVYQGRVNCEEDVREVVSLLREHADSFIIDDPKGYFNVKQNALVVKNAERHYRAMVDRGPGSWNYRVRNFKDTAVRVADYYGDGAKGIVWAHNTHVGDARATPMANQGMENIGYLLRDKFGEEQIFIVGFGTHRGSVLAGSQWGAPMETMQVPEAQENSFGDLFYRTGIPELLLVFDDRTPESLYEIRTHRAKGVVYNPRQERGNYVPTILPQRYNAFIFIEETEPLTPL